MQLVAALGLQDAELLFGFHALGEHAHAQRLAQAHHGADDLDAALLPREVAHEALVHLDLVGRERTQVAQAGIAGAEIVHGDRDAQAAQPVQQPQGGVVVLQQHGLRDLQLQAVRS